jgi:glutathione S-transferase
MKFYNSVGPNPRVVKLFMAEKGIEIPEVTIDLRGGENRRAPYNVDVNPAGQTPALELDDGSMLTEVTAICEYLEERFPEPTLIGTTAEERARTRGCGRAASISRFASRSPTAFAIPKACRCSRRGCAAFPKLRRG